MDKKLIKLWEDFVTAIEKSTKAKESRVDFLKRIEAEGYTINTPGKPSDMDLRVKFCDEALRSRKSRESIIEFYDQMNPAGYEIKYEAPELDVDKVKAYENFIKEVIISLREGESTVDFIKRTEKSGFILTESAKGTDKQFFIKVIEYLNEKAQTGYRTTNFPCSNSGLILARKKEGYAFDDFKFVIDRKVAQWMHTEWEKFLRPATLFDRRNFENYIGERNVKETKAGTAGRSTFGQFVGSAEQAKERLKSRIPKAGETADSDTTN